MITDTEAWQKRARRAGIVADRWPYGPNIDMDMRIALVNWAEQRKLKYLEGDSQMCPHWVAGKRRGIHQCEYPVFMDWLDHPTRWRHTETRKRVLISQPYALREWYLPGGQKFDEIEAMRKELSIRVVVEEETAWYGHTTVCLRFEEI